MLDRSRACLKSTKWHPVHQSVMSALRVEIQVDGIKQSRRVSQLSRGATIQLVGWLMMMIVEVENAPSF